MVLRQLRMSGDILMNSLKNACLIFENYFEISINPSTYPWDWQSPVMYAISAYGTVDIR